MILVLNSKTFSIGIVIDIEIIGTGIDKSIVGVKSWLKRSVYSLIQNCKWPSPLVLVSCLKISGIGIGIFFEISGIGIGIGIFF